jgi:hypothetical protein
MDIEAKKEHIEMLTSRGQRKDKGKRLKEAKKRKKENNDGKINNKGERKLKMIHQLGIRAD